MEDKIKEDQESEPFLTMVQLVNENCSSLNSDQVTTCVEESGCIMKNIASSLDNECNISSLHNNAEVISEVIIELNCQTLTRSNKL